MYLVSRIPFNSHTNYIHIPIKTFQSIKNRLEQTVYPLFLNGIHDNLFQNNKPLPITVNKLRRLYYTQSFSTNIPI